jgi:hypothetical protein
MSQEVRRDPGLRFQEEERLVVPVQGAVLNMSFTRNASCGLAFATALMLLMSAAPAHALSYKQAMAACRAKYGKDVTSVVIKKNGQIVCREDPGRTATRQEVYDYCKKKTSAQTLMVRKKSNGRWECRYYGRF